MTDFNNEKPNNLEGKSFKEQILAEIEEATRLRKLRDEEILREEQEKKEAARRASLLEAEQKAQRLRQSKDAELIAEKIRIASEAQKALEENKLDIDSSRQEVDKVLENLEQAFDLPNQTKVDIRNVEPKPEVQEEESDENLVDEPDVEQVEEKLVIDESSSSMTLENKTEVSLTESQDDSTERDDFEANEMPTSRGRRKRQKTDSLAKRIASVLISAIVIILLVTSFFGYRYVTKAIGPLDSESSEYVSVEIPAGSGNKYIGQILEESGIIKDATIFNFYTKFKNYTNFGSGYYNFKASMDLDEISKLLQEGGTAEPERPALGKILVTEGYTLKQIATAVATNAQAAKGESKKTPFDSEEFMTLIQNKDFISEMAEKYPKLFASLPSADQVTYQLEGYLFPATYDYYEDTTLEGLVEHMLATTDAYLANYYDTIAAKGLTVNEVLSLASLVEKEGSTDEDRRNIASVFYNRLNIAMPLQSNIAILYAMGKLGEKTTLAEDAAIDTAIDSPYNIYTNTGLTPGPVDSPSLSAIEATVNPSSTDYYYFVADVKTGAVYYSETYEEHEANVEKYINSQLSQ